MVRPAEDTEYKPVLYLEHTSWDTIDVAKSHLNWMNFRGRHYFQDIDDNPFSFKNIKCIGSFQEYLTEMEEGRPRVIVSSSSSLERGLAKGMLRQVIERP